MSKQERQEFEIKLEALPHQPTKPVYRLRALLKRALRDWGLKCNSAKEITKTGGEKGKDKQAE